MNVSLICACKNRSNALRVSLASWLLFDEVKEIIIVDWNSDEPINYLTKLDPRIKIVRVEDQKYFNQPQPLNLAFSLTTGDYIVKVDTDYVLNPYHNFFKTYTVDEKSFVSGQHNFNSPEWVDPDTGLSMFDRSKMSVEELNEYFNSYSHYFKYLTGFLLVKRENFLEIGGYNETLTKYYAFEDDEICKRLELYGLEHKKINYDYNLIHLPHPDTKRFENFKGFHESYLKQAIESLPPGEEKWQTEYYISQLHINNNKKMCENIVEYYSKPRTSWFVQKFDEQNYFAEIIPNKKLEGITGVYYVSLEESQNRRDNLECQFEHYGIKPTAIISKRFAESDDAVTGKYVDTLNEGTKGCVVSHLKAIKQWYESTEDDYGFFCEDDLSLDTVDYWDFNWNDFVDKIPEDAECVQLLTIRKEYDTFDIRERYWDDWGATAYIVTRDYAKKLIDTYIKEDHYHLEIANSEVMPLIENILFASVGKSYTYPLFVEEIKFNSTFVGKDDDVNDGQKNNHYVAHEKVLNWWKNKKEGENKIKLKEEIKREKSQLENLLLTYSLDTENPENNFALGMWYENNGHTAPALSYFLRCAERSYETNPDLAYESLIRGSYCYDKQGTRDGSARSLLWQAQMFLPNRPEAYYLLARFAKVREWWQDTYSTSDLALRHCDFDLPKLRTNVQYPGKHGLLYEKAVSGWWWGKVEESRTILLEILENYELPEQDVQLMVDSLKFMGIDYVNENNKEFNYPEGFNWSDLSYEDIITIEREVVHEKVYRFWKDVKEGDVVLDIGASVGAYIISILNQKPKKVYCVEPSPKLLKALDENCSEKVKSYSENPLVYINYGIVDNEDDRINIFGGTEEYETITFNNMVQKYSIDHVDYLKIDCEGGEYSIFKDENMDFLLNKVKFIAMEIHLNYPGCREKFKTFRDKYLTQFNNYKVMSCTRQNISWGNSLDIKDNIFDNDFIDNYTCEFMIYIDN